MAPCGEGGVRGVGAAAFKNLRYQKRKVIQYFIVSLCLFLGMNSILVYVGHGILWRHFPFSWEMEPYGTHAEKLAMGMIGTALWVLIAYFLFCKKIFLKI